MVVGETIVGKADFQIENFSKNSLALVVVSRGMTAKVSTQQLTEPGWQLSKNELLRSAV